MPFTLTDEDFKACKESSKTNYIEPVRQKFEKELKPELIQALGDQFNNFFSSGSHPSPYVARAFSRQNGGMYRGHMWIGLAIGKYSDPRAGIQFQFGITQGSVFVCGIWFEDNATEVKTEALENISHNRKKFVSLLEELGNSFSISASWGDNEELTYDANQSSEKLDDWLTCLRRPDSYLDISKKITMKEAVLAEDKLVGFIADSFKRLLPTYNFLCGEDALELKIDNELEIAIKQFKSELRRSLWKKERAGAYEKYCGLFSQSNLPRLTKSDFIGFLDSNNNKSWSQLQRNQSRVTADIDNLRRVLGYLLNENISITERLSEVLGQKGKNAIKGLGHGLATAILFVCDKQDRYGVWNERSEKTLRRFKLIPDKLPAESDKAYTIVNDALCKIKAKFDLTLVDIDLFVWWVDVFFGKAIMWSVDLHNQPDLISNYQKQIKAKGAALWGVGFTFKKDDFGFPSEIPIPIKGYLYETGNKVTYCVDIEGFELHKKPEVANEIALRPDAYREGRNRTYIKFKTLLALAEPKDYREFKKWEDNMPLSHPPQSYVTIIQPSGSQKVNLSVEAETVQQSINQLITDDPHYAEIVRLAISHLIGGKSIVFYGAPGTSKTYLAKRVCETLCGEGNFSSHTANAEWSYFDLIGGLIPKGSETLFQKGLMLKACEACFDSINKDKKPSWLIIDELNRANLDQAFGKIFTQLDISYRNMPITIEVNDSAPDFWVPLSFRILATMNTFDRSLLFSLGYAFMRRFAFIPIRSRFKEDEVLPIDASNIQSDEGMKDFKQKFADLKGTTIQIVSDHFCEKSDRNPDDLAYIFDFCGPVSKQRVEDTFSALKLGEYDILDCLMYVSYVITKEELVEIGHAITFDAAKFILAYSLVSGNSLKSENILDAAVEAYVLPQLEYFMPTLRKGVVFSDEANQVNEQHWNKVKETMKRLRLSRSVRTLEVAESEFKVIY